MIEKTIKLYTYDELTPAARAAAMYNIRISYGDEIQIDYDEIYENGKKCAAIFGGVFYIDDDHCYIFTRIKNIDDDILNLSGRRALAWINNHYDMKTPPKYHDGKYVDGKYKLINYIGKAHGKNKYTDNIIDGMCYGGAIINAYKRLVENMRARGVNNYSIDDFIEYIQSEYNSEYNGTQDYFYSDEYIKNIVENNEIYFHENGEIEYI